MSLSGVTRLLGRAVRRRPRRREVIDAGAQTILLNPVGRDVAEDRDQMERLAAELIPQMN